MKKHLFFLFFFSAISIFAQEAEIKRTVLKVIFPSPERKGIVWSPKGEKAMFNTICPAELLQANSKHIESLIDPVFGYIVAGDTTLNKIHFILSKKTKESPYRERLTLDSDNNGILDPAKETNNTEAKEIRGKMWVTHNNVMLNVKFKNESVPYMIDVWHVYPKPGEEGDFDLIRYTRKSWMEGKLNYEGKNYRIALVDADNILSFTLEDVWSIIEERESTNTEVSKSFGVPLNKPAFIGEQAFRLTNTTKQALLPILRKQMIKKKLPGKNLK